MGVTKHVRVTSEKVKNAALATVDYGDATVTEAKFSEHMEHGTITGVTVTGRYKTFGTVFSSAPDVVVTTRGTYDAQVVVTPAVGSFKAGLSAGTSNVMFMAWGAR
ncbi:MAG: hypothetical protein KAT65_10425 [Methanophagales archaeon]|nr:hypothetical protein [Methanophagales archaeon]